MKNCQVMDGVIRNGEQYKQERKDAHIREHCVRETGNTPYSKKSTDKQIDAGWSYDDDDGGHDGLFETLSTTPPADRSDHDKQRVAEVPRPHKQQQQQQAMSNEHRDGGCKPASQQQHQQHAASQAKRSANLAKPGEGTDYQEQQRQQNVPKDYYE